MTMFGRRKNDASAVFFISSQGIAKELLFAEFEALLEGFTPELEWAGREANAVYVELSPTLAIKSAVFFLIAFDSSGWVDDSWNIPLVNLAQTAQPYCVSDNEHASGARRTLESQPEPRILTADLAEEALKPLLWSPDLSENGVVLGWIKDAIEVNRLGLSRAALEERDFRGRESVFKEPLLPGGSQAQKLEAQLLESQLQALLESKAEMTEQLDNTLNELEQTKHDYDVTLASLSERLATQTQEYSEAVTQLETLRESLRTKDHHLGELKSFYDEKLERYTSQEPDYLSSLREHYEGEANDKVAKVESEYQELLSWRDVELLYRAEHEFKLHEDIAKLREDYAELLRFGGSNLLKELSEKGVRFTVYQMGIGHVAIPPDDVPLYLAKPEAYMAAYCGVSEEVYSHWLSHYQLPYCRMGGNASECDEDIPRVPSPDRFTLGVSDRCLKHRQTM